MRVSDIPRCDLRRITEVMERDMLQLTVDVASEVFATVQTFAKEHGYGDVVADLKAKILRKLPGGKQPVRHRPPPRPRRQPRTRPR